MTKQLRVALSCSDGGGLLAAVTGRLFDLGADLGDLSFAVLGEAAELTCVCGVPESLDEAEVREALSAIPLLEGGEVDVRPFLQSPKRAERGLTTHVVRVRGENRPGLVARLAEGFDEFGANVVRLMAEHEHRASPSDYVMRFEVWIPSGAQESCLATASNIAERMGLTFHAEPAN